VADIRASLVDATTTPMLLRLFDAGQIDARPLITHGELIICAELSPFTRLIHTSIPV
jgi:hypothetical protein